MRQWTHQHNVPTRRHKVVMPSLFILCEGSKSSPAQTTDPPQFRSLFNKEIGSLQMCVLGYPLFPFSANKAAG